MTRGAFTAQVAAAAQDRAMAWDAVAQVLAPPGPPVVARLRSGDLVGVWSRAARWLGADAEMFRAELMSLEVYAQGSRRRDAATDLAALRAGHAELVGDVPALVTRAGQVARLCRDEADAWSRGDPGTGKAARAAQSEVLTELAPELVALAAGMVAGSVHVLRALGRVLLAVASAEAGKDYQRAVLGDSRGRHRHG